MKNVILIRHLDDIQDFRTPERNNPIQKSEFAKIESISHKLLSALGKNDRILFITSPQRRCIQTAKELAKSSLLTKKHSIRIYTDSRIRDLRHGRYLLPPKYIPGTVPKSFLEAAKVYAEQTFKKGDLLYRHGYPVINSTSIKNPALDNRFTEYGEHQAEFSLRFYEFINEITNDFNKSDSPQVVIIAHTAIIFRFFELCLLFDDIQSGKRPQLSPGEMSIAEQAYVNQLVDSAPNKIFVLPGEVKTIKLEPIIRNRTQIINEIKFLKELT